VERKEGEEELNCKEETGEGEVSEEEFVE